MIRILKLSISFFFFLYNELKRKIAAIFNIKIRPFCITLYYHSIYENEKLNFEKQINLVHRVSTVIRSDYFGELDSKKRYTVITFDDGFENLINNAIPVLIDYKLPFTIFFIANYFGKKPNWDFPEEHRDQSQKIMSVEQVKNLPNDLLTIGSHTANHKKLNTLNEVDLLNELNSSKKSLEELFGKEVTALAFPNGEYNSNVIQKSFESGYKRVFTINPDFSLKTPVEKVSARVWVNGNDWYPEFWLKIHGGYCWLDKAFKLKRKLL